MRSSILLCIAVIALHSPPASAQRTLTITADRANVVASRLAGDWESDVPLTTRLTGKAPQSLAEGQPSPTLKLSFRSDPAVLSKVPKVMADRIIEMQPPVAIYMAGGMTLSGKETPLMLMSLSGNMMVLFFQERNGDPMGDSESFIVQLGVASEPANDLLLVGGDFNNQPFSALKRVSRESLNR